ncbi:MAG: TadE/TadG family type IV pilus assembly protein [Erythrobacter sp.]|nr:TadE/TadG family type IV pilus assembly protein [Erythrobacter sp.]
MAGLFQRIASDRRGSFAIETAFVAPVLILMTLGIAETGTIVARQHELQSVANEAEIIILATNQGATTDVETIKQIVQESVNLSADDVTLTQLFRCNMDETLVANAALCDSDDIVSSYILVAISEDYSPTWTYMGVGSPITFSVERRVQVS